jgi:membrane-associated protease RseP (regulator of RpoE activity)
VLLLGIAVELVIFAAAQALAAAALGTSPFLGATLWRAKRWKQALAFVAGPVAGYLACSGLFVLSFTLEGVPGPTLYLASVTGPAQAAGLGEGDRLISIGGHPITVWDDVPKAVHAANDHPVPFVIERGGAVTSIVVTPVNGRAGITPRIENVTEPFARALPDSLLAPAQGVAAAARGLLLTGQSGSPSVVGPVAVVKSAISHPMWTYVAGLLLGMAWPFALIADTLGFGLLVFAGRRSSALRTPEP